MSDNQNKPYVIEPSDECLAQELPVEESKSASNAFYFACDHYNGRSNYSVCQHVIDAVRRGDPSVLRLRPACATAVESGACPAMKLQKREQEAKRALFFIDRREIIRQLDEKTSQPSTVVRYGKGRAPSAGFKTTLPSADAIQSFERNLKEKGTVIPSKTTTEAFNPDLAGRNLLGDAIEQMMGANK